jgi:hypothetical protein
VNRRYRLVYTPEYIHHLRFSSGSSNELQTQVELSKRVEIVGAEEAAMLIADAEEIGRMLHGLIGSLERIPFPLPPYLSTTTRFRALTRSTSGTLRLVERFRRSLSLRRARKFIDTATGVFGFLTSACITA